MNARIFSKLLSRALTLVVTTTATTMLCTDASAQSGAEYQTDPATGIIYQKVIRTVERPVVETKIQQREQTVFRPQTITETKPESRTIYTPVVEYNWEPRLHGRWNPFRQPAVAYHHIPKTYWEPRNEVIQRTNTRTEWVAEKRTVDVPQRIVRMEREQRVEYEPVSPGVSNAIASRLRPLDSTSGAQSSDQTGRFASSNAFAAPRIAASSVGRMTSDPPRRTVGQGGMRPTELYPSGPAVRGQALPPVGGGSGIATLPSLPFFR